MRIKKSYTENINPIEEMYFYEITIERKEDIIDGDTIDVNIDVGFGITIRERIRIFGIDTPELKTEEGQKAKEIARRILWEDITLNRYFIRTYKKSLKDQEGLKAFANEVKKGKYGRYLGEIFVLTKTGKVWNYNQTLIENGLAKGYFGGKK
ncbi:MAG: thermonuclease family protein [bacterium]